MIGDLSYVRAKFVFHLPRLAPILVVWAKFGEEPKELYEVLTKIGWEQDSFHSIVMEARHVRDGWASVGYSHNDETSVIERRFKKVGVDPLDWTAEEKRVFIPKTREVFRKSGLIHIEIHKIKAEGM